MMEHPHRERREGRTHDWRDCQHCSHYRSDGSSGGVPPWPVCHFWPRLKPDTCTSYVYAHRPWLNEGGVLWWVAAERDELPAGTYEGKQATQPEGRSEPLPASPATRDRADEPHLVEASTEREARSHTDPTPDPLVKPRRKG